MRRGRRNACDGTRATEREGVTRTHTWETVRRGRSVRHRRTGPERTSAGAARSPPRRGIDVTNQYPRRDDHPFAVLGPRTPMTKAGGGSSSRPSSQSHCPERATRALYARTGRHAHAHYACCCRCNRHPRGRCTPRSVSPDRYCLLACLLPRRAMRRRRASALSTAPSWGVQSLA